MVWRMVINKGPRGHCGQSCPSSSYQISQVVSDTEKNEQV